jgi:hypothetical protein
VREALGCCTISRSRLTTSSPLTRASDAGREESSAVGANDEEGRGEGVKKPSVSGEADASEDICRSSCRRDRSAREVDDPPGLCEELEDAKAGVPGRKSVVGESVRGLFGYRELNVETERIRGLGRIVREGLHHCRGCLGTHDDLGRPCCSAIRRSLMRDFMLQVEPQPQVVG